MMQALKSEMASDIATAHSARARFTTLQMFLAFAMAGSARFTLVSGKTGARFTYQVSKAQDGGPHFVALLTGPNNTFDYQFIGTIFSDRTFRPGRKSKIDAMAPSVRAFAWFWVRVRTGTLPAELEVWHEGRCGRCGRALTVPESIASGIGPVCEGKA